MLETFVRCLNIDLGGLVQDGIQQPDPLWTVTGILNAGANAIQMVAPAEGEAAQRLPRHITHW
jgi:hypothetical protein